MASFQTVIGLRVNGCWRRVDSDQKFGSNVIEGVRITEENEALDLKFLFVFIMEETSILFVEEKKIPRRGINYRW